MKITLIVLFYGGPSQLMPLASTLAAVCAFLFLFFNRLVAGFNKIAEYFKQKSTRNSSPSPNNDHGNARSSTTREQK
jgi:hypothetical protein